MPLRRALPPLLLLAVLPAAAGAQQAVLLEFDGDTKGVRGQIVDALGEAGGVELVPFKRYREAAAKAGFRPNKATSPEAIKLVAPNLGVESVIEGEVKGGRLYLRIYDAKGDEVWAKDLPLAKGRLSDENARRLAAAIGVASKPEEPAPDTTAPDTTGTPPADGTTTGTGTATTGATGEGSTPPPDVTVPPDASGTGSATETGDEATPPAPVAPPTAIARPALISGHVAGGTTWRGYCARPGVRSCQQYDDLPEGTEPPGPVVDFGTRLPYLGYALWLELFPLAGADGWWRNLGVQGGWAQAFSLVQVTVTTPNGQTPTQTILCTDLAWEGWLGYRHHFFFGPDRLLGYAGLRGGYRTHQFIPQAGTLFGGSSRGYPAVAADAALPLARLARVEVSAAFFINPRAGQEELESYGQQVRSLGFSASAGLSGDVWGPLGYVFRFQFEAYGDTFVGAGVRWPEGGVAQEFYATLYWGVTAHY